nr:hypothetical protein [Saprospiraceae bacterium]
MLIVGAKGFAKEVLEVCHQNAELHNLAFYDDVNDDVLGLMFGKYQILKSIEEARQYFLEKDKRFTIGIGKPVLRKKLESIFSNIGGTLTSTISKYADIGTHGVEIQNGVNMLAGVKISNSVKVGMLTMIYYN